jgi:hypothetical protein
MADATRELVVQDVATKSDIASVISDITVVRADLTALEHRLKADIAALEQRLTAALDTVSLRLTVRMGVLLAAGLSPMTALLSLLVRLH